MQKGAQAYFSTQVTTTDQGQLLLMLYDGALKFLAQAKEKMRARDMAGKGILISKALDIVSELAGSLNLEKGGTLAENLNNLYFLCTARLLQANARLDEKQLDSVVAILSGLRAAYAQIINTPEARAAAAQISARQNPQSAIMPNRAPAGAPAAPAAPAAGMGRLQAQAAYGAVQGTAQTAPVPAVAEAAPVSTVSSPDTEEPGALPVPPPAAQVGLGRGLAMYGKLTARG